MNQQEINNLNMIIWNLNCHYNFKIICKHGTCKLRKQQTRFRSGYSWHSWELIEGATTLTTPNTCLSIILLSVRAQYSWTNRIWKMINIISMYHEKFYQNYLAQRLSNMYEKCTQKWCINQLLCSFCWSIVELELCSEIVIFSDIK